MPDLLPKSFFRRCFDCDLHWKVASIGGGTILAVFPVVGLVASEQYLCAGFAVAAVVAVAIGGLRPEFKKVNEATENEYADRIDDVLLVLFRMLEAQSLKSARNSGLRMCLFAPEGKDRVVQVTDYHIEIRPRYGRSRSLSCAKGVVGLAVRTGEIQFGRVGKNVNLVNYLVKSYGFSPEEAADMEPDRRSFAAVPIGRKGAVLAVIFLDSSDGNFFIPANGPVRRLLECATVGIAELIHRP